MSGKTLTRSGLCLARSIVLLLLSSLAFAPLLATAAGPELSVVDVDTSQYPSVTVTTEALNVDGLPIANLDQSAFSAYENGQAQTIKSASALDASPTPLSVMLALDTSLSMADNGKLQQAKQAASTFVDQMRPIDHVGLIQFDSQLTLLSSYTSDSAALAAQIAELTAEGNTRIYDALYLALKEAPTSDGSKAIVLMTDGKDTESAIDFSTALALVKQTGIHVYTIGIGTDIDQHVLTQIASVSGGRFYSAPTAADIGYAFQLMSDQLRNRYEITYQASPVLQRGTRVDLKLTAQTSQGLASTQTTYVAPVVLNPTNQTAQHVTTLRVTPGAVMSPRSALEVSVLAALGVLIAAGGLALLQSQRFRHARLAFFIGGKGDEALETGPSLMREAVAGMAKIVTSLITHLLPPSQIRSMSKQLTLAGSPHGWRVGQLVAAKFVLACVGLAMGLLFVVHQGAFLRGIAMMVGLGFLGYRLPTFWIKRRAKLRQNAILRALPDALDLITVCVEAGVGLDGAMLEVVNRWDNTLSEEFSIVLAELKMGRSRRDALRGLSERVSVHELTAFTSALIQADELGMGIARPLSLQAQQLRIRRKQRAEKLAHEASIKMVVAMGTFIMPALFMIILSPAIVQIQAAFGGH